MLYSSFFLPRRPSDASRKQCQKALIAIVSQGISPWRVNDCLIVKEEEPSSPQMESLVVIDVTCQQWQFSLSNSLSHVQPQTHASKGCEKVSDQCQLFCT